MFHVPRSILHPTSLENAKKTENRKPQYTIHKKLKKRHLGRRAVCSPHTQTRRVILASGLPPPSTRAQNCLIWENVNSSRVRHSVRPLIRMHGRSQILSKCLLKMGERKGKRKEKGTALELYII